METIEALKNILYVLAIINIAQLIIILFLARRTGNLVPFEYAIGFLKELAKSTPNKWDDAAVNTADSILKPRLPVTVPTTEGTTTAKVDAGAFDIVITGAENTPVTGEAAG